jgi:hypothetical protein
MLNWLPNWGLESAAYVPVPQIIWTLRYESLRVASPLVFGRKKDCNLFSKSHRSIF